MCELLHCVTATSELRHCDFNDLSSRTKSNRFYNHHINDVCVCVHVCESKECVTSAAGDKKLYAGAPESAHAPMQ